MTPIVVVGVDGSMPSMAAAGWAADEARRRQCPLRVLAAYLVPIVGHPDDDHRPEFADAVRISRQNALDRVEAELARTHPDLEIATSLVESDARTALVEASTRASLTVVGSRGSGRLIEVQLGSVAMHVAAHARSPVAVVPHGLPYQDRPVLVGVDGSADSQAVIGYAFDQAATRAVSLVAVRAWPSPPLRQYAGRQVAAGGADSQDAVPAEQLAGWRAKYPQVPVRQVNRRGQAAAALLGYGQQWPDEQSPQLIVVGSRGEVRFAGGQLGSTSGALIAHAICPIIVVHGPVAA